MVSKKPHFSWAVSSWMSSGILLPVPQQECASKHQTGQTGDKSSSLTIAAAAVWVQCVASPAAALVAARVVPAEVTAAGLPAGTLVAVWGRQAGRRWHKEDRWMKMKETKRELNNASIAERGSYLHRFSCPGPAGSRGYRSRAARWWCARSDESSHRCSSRSCWRSPSQCLEERGPKPRLKCITRAGP